MLVLKSMGQLRKQLVDRTYQQAVRSGDIDPKLADLADRMIAGLEQNAVSQLRIKQKEKETETDAVLAAALVAMLKHPGMAEVAVPAVAAPTAIPALAPPDTEVPIVPGEMAADDALDYEQFYARIGKTPMR